jgi:hypothetical protein
MNIKNCVQNDDGSLDFDFHVTPDEAEFLMDYAIKSLIQVGVLMIRPTETQQQLDLFPNCEGGMQ